MIMIQKCIVKCKGTPAKNTAHNLNKLFRNRPLTQLSRPRHQFKSAYIYKIHNFLFYSILAGVAEFIFYPVIYNRMC
jgi:hypothetical protein